MNSVRAGNPYDHFASVYDIWVEHYRDDLERMRDFYVRRLTGYPGPSVELGVGNGRILIKAAEAGQPMIGIDSSAPMLDLCRSKVEQAGVFALVTLQQADFLDFVLSEPAGQITMPYEAIAHLTSIEDKRACFANVYSQLQSGGRFLFDQRVYDPEAAARENSLARLAFTYSDPKTGLETLFWLVTTHDIAKRKWRTISWLEIVQPGGSLIRRMIGDVHGFLTDRETTRKLLEESGFEVETCLGDFDEGTPVSGDSAQEVWIARRPD